MQRPVDHPPPGTAGDGETVNSSADERPTAAEKTPENPPREPIRRRLDMDWLHLLEAEVRKRLGGPQRDRVSLFSAYHDSRVGQYRQAGALFYAIPKNASSTLHLLLLYAEGIVGREALQNRDYKIYWHLERLGYPYLCMRYYVTRREKRRLAKFSFVRNPWDRLFSFYRDKIAGRDLPFLRRYLQPRYPGVAFQDMEFADFARFVSRLPTRRMEPHFLPQHYFFRPRKMDFIGRVERFDRDLERLIPLLSPAAREKIAAAEIPQLKKTGAGHYAEAYNDETRRLTEQKYARDIRLFGYRFGS